MKLLCVPSAAYDRGRGGGREGGRLGCDLKLINITTLILLTSMGCLRHYDVVRSLCRGHRGVMVNVLSSPIFFSSRNLQVNKH